MRRKIRSLDTFMEPLEQRQLMAADLAPQAPLSAGGGHGPAVVVTLDQSDRFGNVAGQEQKLRASIGGTEIEFSMDGPGAGRLLHNGTRWIVNLTGTTDKTKVDIKSLGDKHAPHPFINNINANRSVGDIKIDGVNVRGRILVAGTLDKLDAEDLRAGAIIVRGAGSSTDLKLANVYNSRIETAGGIKKLDVKSWNDTNPTKDRINAVWIDKVDSDGDFNVSLIISGADKHGESLHDMKVRGAFNASIIATGNVHDIEVGSMNKSRVLIDGNLHKLKVKGDVLATNIAIDNLDELDVDGKFRNSHLAAGVSFNGTSSQIFDRSRGLGRTDGSVDKIKIEGNIARSTFTAGVRPMDGIWGNGNDRFVLNADGEIKKIDLKGELINSSFAAPNLPKKAKVAGHNVDTAGDSRFRTDLA